MLEDELPLELPVGARRRELGRFRESGAVDGTWEILGVCATLAANLYGIFSMKILKVPPRYHLHTKKYGLIKGLLTTIMPQYGPSKALFPG